MSTMKTSISTLVQHSFIGPRSRGIHLSFVPLRRGSQRGRPVLLGAITSERFQREETSRTTGEEGDVQYENVANVSLSPLDETC